MPYYHTIIICGPSRHHGHR